MSVNRIAVVGAGQMGRSIAQVFAAAGKTVTVYDMTREITDSARAALKRETEKLVAKEKLTAEDADEIMARVSFSDDSGYSGTADADLVIEAASERMDVKKDIFRRLDAAAKPGCILATNTSSLSISEIASAVKRRELVIGMHFFNPPTVMKLIEVIRGSDTCDSAYQTVFALAREIGKVPVTVNESPGFVVNRLLVPMINEAIELVRNGVASPEDIDTAMKYGCNHPMGPLALGDLIGLDTCLAIMETLYSETGDVKYRPSALLREMVHSGKLGNKTGEGFFKH